MLLHIFLLLHNSHIYLSHHLKKTKQKWLQQYVLRNNLQEDYKVPGLDVVSNKNQEDWRLVKRWKEAESSVVHLEKPRTNYDNWQVVISRLNKIYP